MLRTRVKIVEASSFDELESKINRAIQELYNNGAYSIVDIKLMEHHFISGAIYLTAMIICDFLIMED